MKYRIRFGIRLSWPITNAATFVFYATPQVKDKLSDAVSLLKLALAGIPGDIEVSNHKPVMVVCEGVLRQM